MFRANLATQETASAVSFFFASAQGKTSPGHLSRSKLNEVRPGRFPEVNPASEETASAAPFLPIDMTTLEDQQNQTSLPH